MSLLLLLRPRPFGNLTDAIKPDPYKKKKHVEEEEVLEPVEEGIVVEAEEAIPVIEESKSYSPQIVQAITEFKDISDKLSRIREELLRIKLEEALMVLRHQEALIEEQRRLIAKRILEMQEEEDLIIFMLMH